MRVKSSAILSFLVLGMAATFASCRPRPAPPAVVLVVLDTLRADVLGAYSGDRTTSPNLDRFAASATVFEQMTASSNNTLSTHSAMFAGVQPTFALQLAQDEVAERRHDSLPARLSQAGIRTAIFGHGPIYRVAATRDFEDSFKHQKGRDGIDQAIAWMKEMASTDDPFFVFLHLYDIHDPYYESVDLIPEDFFMQDREQRLSFQKALKAEGDEALRAAYAEGIQYLDHFLGGLFGFLDSLAAKRQLLVAVTSDHGEAFGEHRNYYYHTRYLYQEIVHVPLFLRVYGQAPAARVGIPVSTVDLAPTIAGFFGLPSHPGTQGLDLLPLMGGGDLPPRYVFAEGRNHSERMIRDRRYKLIQHRQGTPDPLELFDLEDDPGETQNLLSDRPTVTRELSKAMREYFDAEAERLGLEMSLPADAARRLSESLRALGYLDD